MEPIIDIKKLKPGFYAYHLTVGGEPLNEPSEVHESIAGCLQDAAQEMGDGFPAAAITYAGTALGSYPVGRIADDPSGVADEMMERVSALIESRR